MRSLICFFLLVGWSSLALAQDYTQEQLTTSMIENERKAIIAETIEFTEAEENSFWPVYKEYEKEWEEIFDRKVNLLNQYADNYGHIEDDKALEMVEELINIQMAEAKMKKDFLKKYQKVLPGRKLARYYQLENKLAAVINYDLAEIVPLVD